MVQGKGSTESTRGSAAKGQCGQGEITGEDKLPCSVAKVRQSDDDYDDKVVE